MIVIIYNPLFQLQEIPTSQHGRLFQCLCAYDSPLVYVQETGCMPLFSIVMLESYIYVVYLTLELKALKKRPVRGSLLLRSLIVISSFHVYLASQNLQISRRMIRISSPHSILAFQTFLSP